MEKHLQRHGRRMRGCMGRGSGRLMDVRGRFVVRQRCVLARNTCGSAWTARHAGDVEALGAEGEGVPVAPAWHKAWASRLPQFKLEDDPFVLSRRASAHPRLVAEPETAPQLRNEQLAQYHSLLDKAWKGVSDLGAESKGKALKEGQLHQQITAVTRDLAAFQSGVLKAHLSLWRRFFELAAPGQAANPLVDPSRICAVNRSGSLLKVGWGATGRRRGRPRPETETGHCGDVSHHRPAGSSW